MKALMMGAGHYEMAPLSDFTVTETKHAKPGLLPDKDWYQWRKENPLYDDWTFGEINGRMKIKMHANRPTDVNVVLPDSDAKDYDLIWSDDPNFSDC